MGTQASRYWRFGQKAAKVELPKNGTSNPHRTAITPAKKRSTFTIKELLIWTLCVAMCLGPLPLAVRHVSDWLNTEPEQAEPVFECTYWIETLDG